MTDPRYREGPDAPGAANSAAVFAQSSATCWPGGVTSGISAPIRCRMRWSSSCWIWPVSRLGRQRPALAFVSVDKNPENRAAVVANFTAAKCAKPWKLWRRRAALYAKLKLSGFGKRPGISRCSVTR